jgi:phosphatidylglycerophosphate synthase
LLPEGSNLTDRSLFAPSGPGGSFGESGRDRTSLTEGELWARELLDRLRAERFTPGAWQHFFADAFARARHIRARRPEVVRQSRRWGAAGLAASAPLGPRAVAWWALWWAMIDWHLGMLESPEGRPRPLRAQDALTLARLWAAPLVRRRPEPALVAAGMATDLLDGVLARRTGPTRLGRDFDSTADTAFLDAALRGAVERHGLDPGLLALERARLVLGAAVTFRSYFGSSAPAPRMGHRELAAVLAAAGAILAVAGRPRAAEPLLGAAIGYRTLIRVRAR